MSRSEAIAQIASAGAGEEPTREGARAHRRPRRQLVDSDGQAEVLLEPHQCVVAHRPSRMPAAARMKAPVQTLFRRQDEVHALGVRVPHTSGPSGGDEARSPRETAHPTTVVFYARHGAGGLVMRRCRRFDMWLTRCLGATLDDRLAAGSAPEASRLLAARAVELVSPSHRQELARDWERILEPASRHPVACTPRVRIRRDRLVAVEPELREMLRSLNSPDPVSARGVAAVSKLLTDACGPLYNANALQDFGAALRDATSQLDPWSCFTEPA